MGGYFIWNNLKMKNQMGSKTTSDIDKEVNVEQKKLIGQIMMKKPLLKQKRLKKKEPILFLVKSMVLLL